MPQRLGLGLEDRIARIARIYSSVKVKGHHRAVLDEIKALP